MDSEIISAGIVGGAGIFYMIFVGALVLIAVGATIGMILYLLFLQKLLKSITQQNQKMIPGHVWMLLIPGYSLYFQFVLVNKIADSIAGEQRTKGVECSETRPGYGLGIVMCILFCASILPYLGMAAGIGGLVVWIMYWIRLNNYKKQLFG